ncbi:MAG: DUF1002 domain-containing protein [Eubacteriales bacterium]|nr:DUF1002 domain-containing protein [Eubacteriales bacterium]
MKKKLLGSILLGLSLVLGCAVPAMADSRKVVTLGQDLTEEQKNTMMRYFGVDYNSVDVIYINNQNERDHLASYVPLEQIGNYTYSCALVAPTSSGGIQVKTANLTWVTCNMIASTLSTSGVTNCQVVAAAPFKVSGTGALTGVIMAYETASKTVLEPKKVELANQELVATGNLSNEIGQSKATAIINETKIKVIENNVTNIEEINNIVNNVSNEYNVSINEDQSAEIAELMQKIAEQEYDIVQLKATLDRVQANVIGDAGGTQEQIKEAQEQAEISEQAAKEAAEEDYSDEDYEEDIIIEGSEDDVLDDETVNILENTDPDAFGEEGIEEVDTTKTVQEQETESEEVLIEGIPEASEDGTFTEQETTEEDLVEVIDQETTETASAEDPVIVDQTEIQEETEPEQSVSADSLEPDDKEIYDKVKSELGMTFESGVVTDDYGTQVYLTEDAAKSVPEKIENYLLEVLSKGADTVEAEEMADPSIDQNIVSDTAAGAPDKDYTDDGLKQVDKFVRRMVFKDSEKILESSQLTDTDKVVIYDKIMGVLEEAYGVEDISENVDVQESESMDDSFESSEMTEDTAAYSEAEYSDEFSDFEEVEESF